MEPDQFKKEEKKIVLMKEKIPFYLSKFEKVVAENRGYSVGNTVSKIY
jgi:glutathione S-transferase